LSAASYIPRRRRREGPASGLIGAGWYGKSDLWRLVQVDIEIISIAIRTSICWRGRGDCQPKAESKKHARTLQRLPRDAQEKDLDIVLVGSPDHWHALHASRHGIGADVYCQKPISRDVREGEAMVDAARTQARRPNRNPTPKDPHLMKQEANRRSGLLGKIGHVDMLLLLSYGANGNPPLSPYQTFWTMKLDRPALSPLRWIAHQALVAHFQPNMATYRRRHVRAHVRTVRWMLSSAGRNALLSAGGIYVQKEGKSNITDTRRPVRI